MGSGGTRERTAQASEALLGTMTFSTGAASLASVPDLAWKNPGLAAVGALGAAGVLGLPLAIGALVAGAAVGAWHRGSLRPAEISTEAALAAHHPGAELWSAACLYTPPMVSCAKQDGALSDEDDFSGIARDICAYTEAIVRDLLLTDLTPELVHATLRYSGNRSFASRAPEKPHLSTLGTLAAWTGALENAVEQQEPLVVAYCRARLGAFDQVLRGDALSSTLNAVKPIRDDLAHGKRVDHERVMSVFERVLGRRRVHQWWRDGNGQASPIVRMVAARATVMSHCALPT